MAKMGRPVELEGLDRLEEKVRQLVALVGRMRADQARMADEHQRVLKELDAARTRAQEIAGTTAEISSLREERDLIRSRVSSLLEQLEGLNL